MLRAISIFLCISMLAACASPKPLLPDGQSRVPVNQTIPTTGMGS